ncbi:MAG: HDIG domain-containing protein [Fimbriimonadaceae bacterium]|nr:HDIG domain-containing protein [Fimbriimonadaceae bacterium]QYK56197.1 MAG: HDIG domain-containing protein [Fimbriimonadaceae bacterium]
MSQPKKDWATSLSKIAESEAGILVARVFGAFVMGALLVVHRSWPVDPRVFAASAAMSVAALLFVRYHLQHVNYSPLMADRAERASWVAALLAIVGVQLGGLSLGGGANLPSQYLLIAPLVAMAMLVSGLFGPSVALVALSVTSLLAGFTGALPPDLVSVGWVAGAVGAHVVNPMKRRNDLLRAVWTQGLAQILIAAALQIAKGAPFLYIFQSAGWSGVAAVAAVSIFWLGVVLMEKAFGVVSDWTLLEFCSPETPLLKELVLRAPGTHVHSLGVAHLGENAARRIGANPVLVRAMAYFHDIGKINRPLYFIENQAGENPHDDLSPILSGEIIASHVTDGVKLAQENRLPSVLIDGICQHHGTSLISFFYHRAQRGVDSDEPDELERMFRYPGPKPQTKEAAILLLADQIEARSRTLTRNEDVGAVVHAIVEAARADGQLDECELTFRELREIEESFAKTLQALRHERVVYPGQQEILEPPASPGVANLPSHTTY